MMTVKRCFHLLTNPALIVLAILFALTMLSCSGKGSGTVAPPITLDEPPEVSRQFTGFGEGHNIMGLCTILFDGNSWTTQVVFHRSANIHLNLTGFLNHPNCPGGSCLTWRITGYDSTQFIYQVEMELVNPVQYTAYDMRVIFEGLPYNPLTGVGWEVVNPDSHTNIWDPDWDEDEDWED